MHNEEELWEEYVDHPDPDIFENIIVAKDGGFSEIDHLWSKLRPVSAMTVLFYLFSNTYSLVDEDLVQIFQSRESQHFLLSQEAVNIINACYQKWTGKIDIGVTGQALICCLELSALLALWCRFLWLLYYAVCVASSRSGRKWLAVQEAVWETLPELCSFSAMRALHFVTPAVIMSDATQRRAALQGEALWTKTAEWVWLVLSRIAILFFGLDALVLKCRENQPWFEGRISLYKCWLLLIFVKQILGIVQLGMFVRERLFIFVFGGEDSQMQPKEIARKDIWNSLLAMKIFDRFGLWRSIAIMLSFDDRDFQRLVLNEQATAEQSQSADAEAGGAKIAASRSSGDESSNDESFYWCRP